MSKNPLNHTPLADIVGQDLPHLDCFHFQRTAAGEPLAEFVSAVFSGGLRLMRIDRSKRLWLFGVTAGAIFGLLMACGEDSEENPVDGGGPTSAIDITDIIASPRAGGPGDTLLLSAIVTSDTPNEDEIPTMKWNASGGAFLEDNQTSVRWVAPNTGGVYRVIAKATNSVNSTSDSADVFVGAGGVVVANEAGAVHLQVNQTDIFYLRSPLVVAGVEVYSVVGGVVADAVELPPDYDLAEDRQVVYAPDVTFEVHAADSVIRGHERSPRQVILGDLVAKTYQPISVNVVRDTRHSLYYAPDIAADNRSIAFTGAVPPVDAAAADSFDIFVYDKIAGTRLEVTGTHSEHRNVFPTWSTDQSWLTFISDRVSNFRWELYAMRVTGGVVDTDDNDVLKFTDTGGSLASGNIAEFTKPLMKWNPVAPTLAIRGTDGVLYLVATTTSGATQIEVTAFASQPPSELVWSPDGSQLALTTGGAIYTVTPSGTPTLRIDRGNDTFADLVWSPDSRWLLYRATRAPNAWLEVVDLNASPLVPLNVSASEPTGIGLINLGLYRGLMSMSPVWGTANLVFFPTFATGAGTPGIMSIDLTGIVQ
jgi:WD40-like Beta Propeller Repeat